MRLHNIRPFIVPITEFIDIPVVPEISDLPAGCNDSNSLKSFGLALGTFLNLELTLKVYPRLPLKKAIV